MADIHDNLRTIIEDFSLFDDWEDRYRYLIDLGRNLPEMDKKLKTDENFVKGCTSQVWMVSDVQDGRFHFVADSDAHIVRGLIGLLMQIYQNQDPKDVASLDIKTAFGSLGLDQHLSPNRRNGFFAMVERLRRDAAIAA